MDLETAPPPRTRAATWLPALALVALALATYANALGNGFVWDDHRVVEPEEYAHLSTLRTVLTAPDILWKSDPAAYYRPLARATYLVDRQLFGLDPRPYHLENVLLHAAVAVLLFALARRLIGGTGPALAGAALFAAHPVCAEVVDFVTARNNLLVAVSVLGSTLLYLRGRREGRRGPLVAGATVFFLGLLCKETAAMLLPFLGAWELVAPHEPHRPREPLAARVAPLLPWAAAAAAYVALRATILPSLVGTRPTTADVAAALVRDLHIVPTYLRLLLFPAGLTVYHPEPGQYFSTVPALVAVWAAIAVGVGLLLRGRRPATRFGLLWFAVNFLPVSTIIPMPSASIAERHLYIPALGLALVVADQLAALVLRLARPRAVAAAVLVAVATLGAVTAARARDWHDDVALFSSALRVNPGSSDARFAYSLALVERGDVEGARREWERIAATDPRHTGALSQLGTYHAERGRLAEAGAYFARVLALDPRDVEARFDMALLLERTGRAAEALAQYEAFLALNPVDYPELVPRVVERVRRLRASLPPAAP